MMTTSGRSRSGPDGDGQGERHRVLIVDDDELNTDVLKKVLGDDYVLATACSGEECLEEIARFHPALVLLDIMMPGIDGYETCERIKSSPETSSIQVILVSARASTKERLRGYEAGADDYLVKPFDHDELRAKVRVQLKLRRTLRELTSAHAEIQAHLAEMEERVRERTAEVIEIRDVTVFALAKLAESRDPETGEHLERMRKYCRILAEQLSREGPYTSEVDEQFVNDIYQSSPLHDIGKVGIPDVILLKSGRLTTGEFEIMKRHAVIGAEALEGATQHTGSGRFLKMAADIARYHHERYDGSGYAAGLCGSDIPLSARIVAVADVYDALTSVRVYKAAYEPEVAKLMIEQEEGRHFDPAVVDAFRARYDDFLRQAPTWEGAAAAMGVGR